MTFWELFHNMHRRFFYFLSYFGKPPWDSGISPPELMEFLENNPPGIALDLGCGTGTNAITLAQYGWKTTAIDFMPKAIWLARKKARQSGLKINFRLGDVTHLKNLAGPFDLILDIGCYHNLSPHEKRAYRVNLSSWLAPAGAFLLYGFLSSDTGAQFGITPTDLEEFTKMLMLISRTDSTDRDRPSTWLLFRSLPKESENEQGQPSNKP